MMKDSEFWRMVEKMGWPEVHYDEAKYRFMLRYPPAVAEEFEETFLAKKAELRKAGRVEAVSDGWDDTLAHIIGLGKAAWEQNLANPTLMFQREESLDYKESFAYCIPFPDDYKLLTDEGYEPYLRSIRKLLARMDATDPDDVPPREYRLYPEIRALGERFLERNWQAAVDRYHNRYGPGYADSFPTDSFGYVIPNLVRTLERFRLREHAV
ncbi:MAG: hypothetical protein ACLFPW_13145 [Spirochaetaceae bacterium]